MNLEFSPEEIAFRDEVRTFIAENYPVELRGKQDEGDELSKEDFLSWHKVLAKKGWVAPAWPVEYGGTGWTPTQRYIWSEETARADCIRLMPFGLTMVGPVIYTFGTPEQKAKAKEMERLFVQNLRNGLQTGVEEAAPRRKQRKQRNSRRGLEGL